MKDKPIILIVDDIQDNIVLISDILSEENIEINFAVNGSKAIKTAKEIKPDLVLLDIAMPEMDGYEVCRRLKDDDDLCEIPIIFLTAKVESDDIVKGLELGAVDYITKPFNPTELQTRVKNHLKLKTAKDLIDEQNKKLTELNATKDKFFSIIAHDLKNPLGLFLSTTQYLTDNIDNFEKAEMKEFLQITQKSAENLVDLINNLLQWSRSQSGRIEVYPTIVYLKSLVELNFDLVKDMASNKGLKLINNIDDDTKVYADENMVNTVFRNLIANAIKYSNNEGNITISVVSNEDTITTLVEDQGVGIEPQNISKLFRIDVNYFTRGTDNEEGTGLGLILCKEFIEKNKGKIWVESVPGKGSTFSFSLPKPQ